MPTNHSEHIAVYEWMVDDLHLQGRLLLCYAMIYCVCQQNDGAFNKSRKYLSKWLGCSLPTVDSLLLELIDRKLIEKISTSASGSVTYKASALKNIEDTPIKPLYTPIKPLYTPIEDSSRDNSIKTEIITKEDNNRQNKKEKETIKKKTKTKEFIPPTLDEVDKYIKEKNYHFSAKSFIDYYESDDWHYGQGSGRKKVQNWKRCCATWEGRRIEKSGGDADVEHLDATRREEQLLRKFYGILGEQEADIYGKDRYSWTMLTPQQKEWHRKQPQNRSKLLAWIREHDG